MKEYKKHIDLSLEEVRLANDVLEIEEGYYEDAGKDEVIKCWTVKFDDGFEADIKLCNGDTPYVDSVLFDSNGYEVDLLEASGSLLGEHSFEFRNKIYIVVVRISDDERLKLLTEDQMEQYLIQKGYDLGQNEPPEYIVDSTLTFEYSIEEGFQWIKDENEEYLFYKQ